MFRKQLEILAIGDITTDAFIRLKDAHIHAEVDHSARELCMGFGDKIPFEYVKIVKAVGNAANSAAAAARLGLRTALVANVGDDQNGRDCIIELDKEKVGTAFVRTQKFKTTNYHFVLWFDTDRTILVNHTDFDYRLPEALGRNKAGLSIPGALPPKWVYLTSLAGNSFPYQMQIADYLDANPGVRLAFQPGTFQMKLGPEKLSRIYSRADVVMVNLEEAQKILNKDASDGSDIKSLLAGVAKLGPKLVAITDGTKGSYLFDGDHYYHIPIYPDPKPAIERTGCGDAWASTFVSALAMGRTPLEAFTWAPVNAMAVSQFIGSREGLLTLEQLEWWLSRAPEDFKPREL